MMYDTEKIKKDARKEFSKRWKETESEYPQTYNKRLKEALTQTKTGKAHHIQKTIQQIRQSFLKQGFIEVENPLFVEERDVYRQYGPEAPAILDRCYYLAGLPRPDIGLSDSKLNSIQQLIGEFDHKILQNILRDYKLGRIEGDDLAEEIKKQLKTTTEQAIEIINNFEELKNLKPEPTKTTLRSHMTAAWFPTLEAVQEVEEQPIRLFSIGLRFRKEQRVDASHLRAHYGASCVVLDEDMCLEAGREITARILKPLGFKDFTFEQKEATSTYYANKSEYEVFAKTEVGEDVEIADFGMYSPTALAQYGIKYPVFNAGFGVERILMILNKEKDVRGIMFPQFYKDITLDDKQLASELCVEKEPATEEGSKLAKKIYETAKKHANEASPCEFTAYEGEFLGKKIEVKVVEPEEKTRLLGPACLNKIYIHDGSVAGVPEDVSKLKPRAKEFKEKGIETKIEYLDALSKGFSADIENSIQRGERRYEGQIKMASSATDVNVGISNRALTFIQSRNKQLMLKGPIFMTVRAEVL